MHIEKIAEQLERTGYIVLDNPLLAILSAQLFSRCQDNDTQRFHAARVGRGLARKQVDAIRGDVISWLDDADHIDHAYLVWMEQLRNGLNATLYLGLFDYECWLRKAFRCFAGKRSHCQKPDTFYRFLSERKLAGLRWGRTGLVRAYRRFSHCYGQPDFWQNDYLPERRVSPPSADGE